MGQIGVGQIAGPGVRTGGAGVGPVALGARRRLLPTPASRRGPGTHRQRGVVVDGLTVVAPRSWSGQGQDVGGRTSGAGPPCRRPLPLRCLGGGRRAFGSSGCSRATTSTRVRRCPAYGLAASCTCTASWGSRVPYAAVRCTVSWSSSSSIPATRPGSSADARCVVLGVRLTSPASPRSCSPSGARSTSLTASFARTAASAAMRPPVAAAALPRVPPASLPCGSSRPPRPLPVRSSGPWRRPPASPPRRPPVRRRPAPVPRRQRTHSWPANQPCRRPSWYGVPPWRRARQGVPVAPRGLLLLRTGQLRVGGSRVGGSRLGGSRSRGSRILPQQVVDRHHRVVEGARQLRVVGRRRSTCGRRSLNKHRFLHEPSVSVRRDHLDDLRGWGHGELGRRRDGELSGPLLIGLGPVST